MGRPVDLYYSILSHLMNIYSSAHMPFFHIVCIFYCSDKLYYCVIYWFDILPDTYKACSQPEGNFMLRGIGYMKCQPWMMWIFVNCAIHSLWVYLLFLSQIIQVHIISFNVHT